MTTLATGVETMTSRERWLATLDCRPVDRLVFWPKLNGSYPPAQVEPFRSMSLPELHEWVGSDMLHHVGQGFRTVDEPGFRTWVEKGGERERVSYFQTPTGTMDLPERWDDDSKSWHPVDHPVRTRDDIVRMAELFRQRRVEIDEDGLAEARSYAEHLREEQTGAIAVGVGESPLMYCVEWLCGIENIHYHLHDYPDEMAELFDALHEHLADRIRVLAEHNPADFIWLTENTSTTLISVEQYEQLNAPHIEEYARICDAAGNRLILHMCGHLKKLLPRLATMPTTGFEAFTAPTLGNTTLLDGRTACPDKCLIGGTHAMLWIESADRIIDQIRRWLDELPHHRGIAVTSSGVMPPACSPETIRKVRDWVTEYPVRN